MMNLCSVFFFLYLIFASLAFAAQDTFSPYDSADQVPRTVEALWQNYDAKAEPLEVKVHHERKKDGVVTRLVSFKVGTFKGTDARMAAYYCFPENGNRNPAFVWSHGGGQRADRQRGHYFAAQGFASIDINWLGRPLDPDLDPDNEWGTDWGKVDPTQGPRFYPKALRKGWKRDLRPDQYTIDPIISPRNSNWFLLTVAARRALTFLEQQPEVDAGRLGFTGYSMGGTITSMAAIDKRLKAVVPFVGGSGHRHKKYPGMESGNVIRNTGDQELYKNTIDPAAYWKHVRIPVFFITSSNDFHAHFHRIYTSMECLPHDNWRVTGNLHANHGPSSEQWVLLNHFFKQHLAGENKHIPVSPPSTFKLGTHTASFSVTPAQQERLVNVEIYYSYDPNCVTRFWKRAPSRKVGNTWKAELKIHGKLPQYAFALCRYRLAKPEVLERGNTTSSFTLNTHLQTHIPENIDLAAYTQLEKTGLVDDFSNGLQNWWSRNQTTITTYKFQDPELDTSADRKLAITLNLTKGKPLVLNISADSKFLGAGRDLGGFHHDRLIAGSGLTTVVISLADFKGKGAKPLEWSKITTFSVTLTDQETRQKMRLADPNTAKVLRRIEFIDK